jgi:hypothetical protein
MQKHERDRAIDVPGKPLFSNCSFLSAHIDHITIELFQVLTPLRLSLAGWFGVDAAGNGIAGNDDVRKVYFDRALRCREDRGVESVARSGFNTIARGILRRRARSKGSLSSD